MERQWAVVTGRYPRGSAYNGQMVSPGQIVALGAAKDAQLLTTGYLQLVTKDVLALFKKDGTPPGRCRIPSCGAFFLNSQAEQLHYFRVHEPEIKAIEKELTEAKVRVAEADGAVAAAEAAKAEAEDAIPALEACLAGLRGEAVAV